MKNKLFFSVLLVFFNCLFFIFSQTSEVSSAKKKTFSVEDSVKFAIENNVSIAQKHINLNAVKRSFNTSWNSISPNVNVGAGFSIPMDESSYDYSYNISASVSLSFSANLYSSVNGAKLAYESGKLSFEDAVRSLELSVRESFYTLIYEKEYILLAERNLSIAKKQYENNLAKYNQGRLSEIDVLSAEVNYKSKIPEVEKARINYENDLAIFKQLLGLESNDVIELSGNLESRINLKSITLDGINYVSPEIKLLEYDLNIAKNDLLSKRFSAYSPSISANWNYKDSWTEPDVNNKNPVNSSSISLSASIPLDGVLPWSQKSTAIKKSVDSVELLELQLNEAERDLSRRINSALRSINQSQSSIKYKQANVNLAQKNYDMTSEAYNRGTKDLLSLQSANTSLMNAQVSLKNEILVLIKSILNLEKTIGVPFGTL